MVLKKGKVYVKQQEDEQEEISSSSSSSSSNEEEYKPKPSGKGKRTSIAKCYTNVDPGMANHGQPKKMMSTWVEYEDERLGDDFEDTVWVPPTVGKALEFRERMIYRGGRSSIWSTKLRELEDMGIGVALYFRFIKYLIGTFTILTILSVPSLLFALSGNGMGSNLDVAGWSVFSLGNVGLPCEPLSGSAELMKGCNGDSSTIQNVYGTPMPLLDISYSLTAFEVMGSIFFLLSIIIWRWMTDRIVKLVDGGKATCTDYAVFVQGLPRNAQRKEVTKFFSDLYALDAPDWTGRTPQEGAQPVFSVENTGDKLFLNKWVADVRLAYKVGDEIAAYKKKRKTVVELKRSRAHAKMYNEGTPLLNGEGENPRKYNRWVKKSDKLGLQIAKTTDKIMGARADVDTTSACVGAFVTFNHPLSMHRCMEDFSSIGWHYPKSLLYQGTYKLKVSAANEPDNIIFENIEFSAKTRWWRRKWTAVVSALLLVLSFVLVLALRSVKEDYGDSVPKVAYCSLEVPAAYIGNYTTVTESFLNNDDQDLHLVRPPTFDRIDLDASCVDYTHDPYAVYAVYSSSTSADAWREPYLNYSLTACGTFDGADLCPTPTADVHCPCLSASSPERCNSLQCSLSTDETQQTQGEDDECSTFSFSTVAGCYCIDRLQSAQQALGAIGAIEDVRDKDGEVCGAFLRAFLIAFGLNIVIAASTPVINMLLARSQRGMVKWERSMSDDEAATRLMSGIFQTQFINTGLLVLVVFGRPPLQSGIELPQIMVDYSIFNGDYGDFSRAWYGNVGAQIIVTFILAAVTPHLAPLLNYLLLQRVKRYRAAKAASTGNPKQALQYDLNELYVGPVFDFTARYSYLLMVLFVGYTYSGGLPLMTPLCLFFFVGTYWLDKMLLLRFYRRPPHREDALQRRVNDVLPIALIFHVGFTFWMFSAPGILYSEAITKTFSQAADFDELRMRLEDEYGMIMSRAFQTNSFPLFVVWLLVVSFVILHALHAIFPVLSYIWAFVKNVLCCMWVCRRRGEVKIHPGKPIKSPWTSEVAAFTDTYYQFISSSYQLTTAERIEGWISSTLKDGTRVKKKGWDIDQDAPAGRDAKFTWEAISDNSVYSYDINIVPGYAEIMAALLEEERMYKADMAAVFQGSEESSDEESTEEDDASQQDEKNPFRRDIEADKGEGKKSKKEFNPFDGLMAGVQDD